jgi:hypothetical protein
MSILIGLLVFITIYSVGIHLLQTKMGLSASDINKFNIGMVLYHVVVGGTSIIMGLISLNPNMMIMGLIKVLLSGWFAKRWAERDKLI